MQRGPDQILTLLGEGGGGHVYRAWDPRLQREVALKVLRQRSEADPERVRRFIAEARAASALNHPNIVTVFDAAVLRGHPVIVSELIYGADPRVTRSPGARYHSNGAGFGAAEIADGLAAAHEPGSSIGT